MSASELCKTAAAVAVGAAAKPPSAAKGRALKNLIKKIKDNDPEVRTEAWLSAGKVGAPAIPALAELMSVKDAEVARAAKRGMWKIVRHVGNPDTDKGKRFAVTKLLGLLGDDVSVPVGREVLWMLSELGTASVVEPIAALLDNKELREDARMVLERIPGPKAKGALRAAFKEAPEDFKQNLAQSLRKLGVNVKGYPCVKLKPVKQA